MWLPCSPIGAQSLWFATLQCFELTLARHMFLPMMVCGSQQDGTEWLLPHCIKSGVVSCYSPHCSLAIPAIWWGIHLKGSMESHLIPLPSLEGKEVSSFPGSAPTDDTGDYKFLMRFKPGDSDEVIRYQVDKFTHTWWVEHFITQSHFYPGFTGKLSTFTNFPLQPGCEDYSFCQSHGGL